MMFDDVFDIVVGIEGGYVNDPKDPGGETKFGISKRSYPNVDIANLTIDTAKIIYLRDFWGPLQCAALSFPIALALFDYAVNSGAHEAVLMLQRSVDKATQDGKMGPQTVEAVNASDPLKTLIKYVGKRHDFMKKLANWKHNETGWTDRLFNILVNGAR